MELCSARSRNSTGLGCRNYVRAYTKNLLQRKCRCPSETNRSALHLRMVGRLGTGDGTEHQPLPGRARGRCLQIPFPGLEDGHGQCAGRVQFRPPLPRPDRQLDHPRIGAVGPPRRRRPRRDGSHRAFADAGLLPVDLLALSQSNSMEPRDCTDFTAKAWRHGPKANGFQKELQC